MAKITKAEREDLREILELIEKAEKYTSGSSVPIDPLVAAREAGLAGDLLARYLTNH